MRNDDALLSIRLNCKKLPTLPGIALKIIEITQKQEPSLDELVDIIALDPALSVEILKLINSSFYNLPQKIVTVHHAAQMLGMQVVKNLALSFTLVGTFSAKKEPRFDQARFWRESVHCAVAARILARLLVPGLAEDAFFIGLLHNIGILALIQAMPRQYQAVLRELELAQGRLSDYVIENKVLGFNHMQVGQYLARSWGLPDVMALPIGCHHGCETLVNMDADSARLCQILHLSTLYLDYATVSDRPLARGMIEFYCKRYDAPECASVETIMDDIDHQAETLLPLFDLNPKSTREQRRIVAEAREQLVQTSMDVVAQVIEQKRLIENLHQRTRRDGMTQLYNYHGFQEILQLEKERSERYKSPFSIILSDIDDFKKINDSYGHLAGDAVIKHVAAILSGKTRSSDCVARYGGEEFAIILPETAITGALTLAERLRRSIAATPIDYEHKTITVTMSFGITSAPIGALFSKEELIDKADQVLYEAKRKGKNQCCACYWEST